MQKKSVENAVVLEEVAFMAWHTLMIEKNINFQSSLLEKHYMRKHILRTGDKKMIIESKDYNKPCTCGKEHKMITKTCIIEKGCLKKINYYLKNCGLEGYSVTIYDENTYKAVEKVRPNADEKIILSAENLHADNYNVDLLLEKLPKKCDYLIAVGSGTIHDLTRYCAFKKNIPFVSCPTAASVDGFCSSVAAMTWYGYKKTLIAQAPVIVIADLEIISKAPMYLTKSGFGDMIGKYIALAEWKIAREINREDFCDYIYELMENALKQVMESADGIKNGDISSYEKLTYGLLISGLAMQLLGNSRCASGAEHHISHFIEMQPEGFDIKSNALHGEKVGVGTILAAEKYYEIKDFSDIPWEDYKCAENELIESVFGKNLSESVINENSNDCCYDITAKQIREHWRKICEIIKEIPSPQTLKKIFADLEIKSTLTDIGVSEQLHDDILKYSPIVRNRMTLMRLIRGATR